MLTELSRTADAPAPAVQDQGEPMVRRGLRLLPGALVLITVLVVLRSEGVGLSLQARFLAHLVGAVLLPGVLVWRALRGRSGALPFDLAGGAALGYVMEIGWYVAGRVAGFPYLHVVAAAVVVGVFLAVPRLRRHWRGTGRPTDARWAWSVAALCLPVVGWAWGSFLDPYSLNWPAASRPYPDMVFHQALVGELRHHLPAKVPYVDGVPLAYHWFVHADWAAASWSTGIEPFVLTYRLGLMPAVVLLVVAIAAVAQRIVPGRWWSGPLAAGLALFALPGNPAGWGTPAAPAGPILSTMWISPSQTFGSLLFAGAILALADLLRPADPAESTNTVDSAGVAAPAEPGGPADRPSVGRWVAFGLLVAGATGGKATYAPLLLAGLGSVVAVGLLRRRFERRATVAAVITLIAFGLAMKTMFPGTSGGLFIAPLASARPPLPGWTVGHVLAIWALGWAPVLAAGVVLLRRRGWADPMLVTFAGIAAAAVGVVLLAQQLGGSQAYFLVSARPYAAVLIVAALVAVAPRAAAGRWMGWLVVVPATVCGVVAVLLARQLSEGPPPRGGTVAILWPHTVPLLAAAALALVLYAVRRTKGLALLAAGAVLIGAVGPSTVEGWRAILKQRRAEVGAPYNGSVAWTPIVPPGAPAAGRWLRANTGTDDLLATNSHCRFPGPSCDPRQFWLAAFGERRVLVEGWAYTAPANEIAVRDRLASSRIPYWDPARLAENDAAFLYPSVETVAALRSKYRVRWLVVDTRRPYDRAALERVAQLRHRAGYVEIYQAGW